jgi:hypothetical protein
MNRSNLDRYFADNIGLVHEVARRCQSRLIAIGAPYEYNDLVQELSEVFIHAYDLFDESKGLTFSTYFMTSAMNRINGMAENVELERIGVKTTRYKDKSSGKWKKRQERVHAGSSSIEELSSNNSEGDISILDTIDSGFSTPEEIAIAESLEAVMMSKLSPLAAMVVKMTIDPPEFIEREIEAAQAHAEYSRANGIERRSRSNITASYVCSVLEKINCLESADVYAIKSEIKSIVGDIV